MITAHPRPHLPRFRLNSAVPPARVLLAGLALAALSACATHEGVSVRENGVPLRQGFGNPDLLPKPGISQLLSPFDKIRVQILPVATAGGLVLEPYDTLKYEFNFRGDDYHILPGDELNVRLDTDSKHDLTLTVRPDGNITLPNAGEVTALGKNPKQLAADINEAYRGQMNQPAVSVTLTKSSLSLEGLSGEAVVQDDGTISIPRIGRTAAAGLTVATLNENLSALASTRFKTSLFVQVSREIPGADKQKTGLVGFDQVLTISADGHVALPEIGVFAAGGKTISMMQDEIQDALHSRYKTPMTIAIAIESSEARIIYVDGEVGHPGAFPLSANMTLLKAVTLAGGVINTGDMRQVTLIHRDDQNNVYVYVSNLKDFIEKGAKDNDLALSSQDIVVVPKSAVAKANLWVEQYITDMLPFSRSVGYNYTQGRTTTNP